MNTLLKDPLSTFLFLINHWSAVLIVFGIISGLAKYFLSSLQKEVKDMRMNVKRLELIRAIDHDYSFEVVCQIYDEYVLLGGNSYAQEIFEKYKERKLHEKE
jgi:uncharacterized membrane protein